MIMEKEKLISLVTAAQNGDSNAINELFNAFYEDLRYFALKTVKDEDLSYEITQEAFIEIINTLQNLKEPAAFVTWAKQITYHQCTRYFKKKKDVIVDEDEDGGTIFDNIAEENTEFIPDEALSKTDFKQTVLGILDELSEEQRSATMMYYFDELSVRQIADIQGVSEGTVKSRLNYARKSIKASVEEYERKSGIKLHAIPFFPLIKWIFTTETPFVLESATAVAEAVSTATGVVVTLEGASVAAGVTATATGVAAAGTTAVSVGTTTAATTTTVAAATATTATAVTTATTATTVASASIGAKIIALPLVTKIIAGITAVAIAAGGTTAAVLISQNADNGETQSDRNTSSSQESTSSDLPVLSPIEYLTVLEGTIPAGCTYILHDGTELKAGNKFPEECTPGDKVDYGDYYYGYERIYVKGLEEGVTDEWLELNESFDVGDSGVTLEDILGCWTPAVKDRTKEAYGKIAHSINGKEIRNLFCTFNNCTNLKVAPEIPPTVTSISMAFYNCRRLTQAPVIPESVERLTGAFQESDISGDVVYNGTLDKSTFWYYYAVVETGNWNEINLTGSASEEDLQLIGENSVAHFLTINGKDIVRYYDTNRLDGAFSSLEEFCQSVRQFYRDEPTAGYSGDYESGEECSSIYAAPAISDHFDTLDFLGYNLTEIEFMLYSTAYGDAYYTFNNKTDMSSNYELHIGARLNFRTLNEAIEMLRSDYTVVKNAFPEEGCTLDLNYSFADVDVDTFVKHCFAQDDKGVSVWFVGSLNGIGNVVASVGFSIEEVDGHYEYHASYRVSLPPEYMLAE